MTWHARAAAWGALAVFLASGHLAAFQAPTGAITTAGIRGRIRSAADDRPIARARVMATPEGASDPYVAISGTDGTYALADLPPGSYTLSVSRTGFAPYTHGQDRTADSTPIVVTAGQQAAIDVRLVAGLAIAGRILDEDGAPFAGAIVEALVPRTESGIDRLVSTMVTETNDKGEFRLFGLAPGHYYVTAADPAFRAVATAKGVQRYAPTYYPGVAFPDQARRIAIGDGKEAPPIEFKLQLVPPAQVSGLLAAEDARPLINGAITLSPITGSGVPTTTGDPQILPDGRFAFAQVAPGRYQIRARAQTHPNGPALFAVFSVEVLGSDVTGIVMTLHPGAVIDGTVRIERNTEAAAPPLTSLRVRAPFSDGNGFGDSLTGAVRADGAFALRGVMEGTHQLAVEGLPPAWFVKSIHYRGADITDREIDVEQKQALRDVRIVISDGASVVSGVVRNAQQRPVANTGVLVYSSVPLFWMRTSRRLRIAYTDAEGRFSVAGLPAGAYVAVASPWIDDGDLGRRDRLRALQPLGVPFTLDSDDSRATVTLEVLTTPAGTSAGGA